MKNMFSFLFSPFGNISRLPFFLGLLVSICMMWASVALFFFPTYFLMHKAFHQWVVVLTMFCYLIGVIVGFASLWSAICLHLKRIADLRLSCFLIIIPFACGVAENYLMNTPYSIVIHIILITYLCGLLFWPSRV